MKETLWCRRALAGLPSSSATFRRAKDQEAESPQLCKTDHQNIGDMYSAYNTDARVNGGAEYEQPALRSTPFARRAAGCILGYCVKARGVYRGASKLQESTALFTPDSMNRNPGLSAGTRVTLVTWASAQINPGIPD
jgi:hypothetical protein